MHREISGKLLSAALLILLTLPLWVQADELTENIQKDLVALGYDPGNINGELTTDTTVAISKFQAERDMPVTGEVSPQLAGVLSAAVDRQRNGPALASAGAAPAPAVQDPAALQAAQQACLQEKIAAAQASNKKRRGFGRLVSAVTRTAATAGNSDVAQTASDVYAANATAADLAAAAEDLGLTEDDVAACQNP
jgi:peptidoglycan hydrolase-like protein with peptidoglycan-binding domain